VTDALLTDAHCAVLSLVTFGAGRTWVTPTTYTGWTTTLTLLPNPKGTNGTITEAPKEKPIWETIIWAPPRA